MSRHRIDHPEKPGVLACYGLNGALSWWAEVREAGRLLVEYDAITCGVPTSPAGILGVLVKHGFFGQDDIYEARDWLIEVEDVEEIDDEGAKRAAEVITNLREAAGASG